MVWARSAARDAGGDALAGVDADGERRLHALGVVRRHRPSCRRSRTSLLQRHAEQAAAVRHRESDQLGRGQLGGEDEVALVLAVLVVDDDDGRGRRRCRRSPARSVSSAGRRCSVVPFGRGWQPVRARPSSFSTYFARTSTSRLTGSPGPLAPSVVSSSVVGIRLTSNQSVADRGDGQADAVDRDRALLDDVAVEAGGQRDAHDGPVLVGPPSSDAGAVDVALHEWPPSRSLQLDRPLEVDRAADRAARRGRSGRGVSCITSAVNGRPAVSTTVRQTPLTADRVAVAGVRGDERAADGEPARRRPGPPSRRPRRAPRRCR